MNEPAVLVIEDDANDFFLLQLAFEKLILPHKLVRVIDGEQGLRYLKGEGAFADRSVFPFPALVLLDIKMPRCDGFEVLERLKEDKTWNVPVVVLSGSALPEDKKRARKLGATDYLVKEQTFDGVMGIVKSIQKKWLSGKKRP